MKKALVVGINGYGFPNDLGSAVRDAEAFANVLDTVYRFDHVRVLTDGDATRDGVDRGLEWLCQSANTNDRLVVFFSGHGCRFERNGVLEDALVLQDGRLLDHPHLADRMENVPAGIFTLVLDCCFSGPDETLIHPSGQVEVVRAKRWIPTELDRGRSERSVTPGLKAFAPFGHAKPAPPSTLGAHIRTAAPVDRPPARLTTLDEPQAKVVIVLPCLADETTPVATSRTNDLSPFTYGLVNAIRRLGPNRSAIEVLQATGHELRQLGLDQTPLVMEPAEPEHLGLRAFLTFQPVLFVHPASTPGKEEIAEAVRSTLINIKEGRSMQATIPGAQTFFGEDIGTIVNTVTPIVASMLQGRAYQQQPYGGGFSPFGQGVQGGQGWPGAQGQGWWQGGFQSPYAQGFHGQSGANLQPYEIAQIVSAVTPLVVSLLQSRNYQGHFGQFLPRAA